MSVTYYYIKDLKLLGKDEDYVPYLYKQGKGWIMDNNNIIMDRVMGYDGSEPADSPYKVGATSVIDLVEEISEKEAEQIIENL